MELEVLDSYIIDSSGDLEDHNKKVAEKIQQLEPEYYTVETNIIRVVLKSKITVMGSK